MGPLANPSCHIADAACHIADASCHIADAACHIADAACHIAEAEGNVALWKYEPCVCLYISILQHIWGVGWLLLVGAPKQMVYAAIPPRASARTHTHTWQS